MDIIVSYDITTGHIPAKAALLKNDFFDFIMYNNKKAYLPNTTLVKYGVTKPEVVLAEVISIIKTTAPAAKIQRCVVFQYDEWAANVAYNEPHSL